MNKEQWAAAMESMTVWLAHPHELGKPPAKVEYAGEFERHGMRYYIFKYQKSLLSFDWLLGVCGGYEGDSLDHCGHVYSEMEKYDPATAEEKAVAMVEMIREYWLKVAERAEARGEDEEADGGSFVAFVLLDSAKWDSERLRKDMEADWDVIVPEDASGQEDDEDGPGADITRLVWEEDGMIASVALMPAPVPDGEAERNAATSYMWPEAVAVTQTHRAHLLVAVLLSGESYVDAGSLMVKIASACLKQENAIGVYASGTVFEPEFYREAADVMKSGEPPILNLVYFGVFSAERGFSAYTYGMKSFGKNEMEILDSVAAPNELRDVLFEITAYVISQDVTLRDGETLGVSEKERIPITRSDGVCLARQTLKIGYRPA